MELELNWHLYQWQQVFTQQSDVLNDEEVDHAAAVRRRFPMQGIHPKALNFETFRWLSPQIIRYIV
jgi:hypothetical protein